jgi:hypothetical protein
MIKTKIETEKQILNLRLQGDSYKVIIEKTGASSSTVSRILRKHALIIAMDRDDDLYDATTQFRIGEHVQNRYLARNLIAVEEELSQRSLKILPFEKLQAIARNLRSDIQKLQDKREQQLEKCSERAERDAAKQKEGNPLAEEQDDQAELAQVPIIPLKQETSPTPKSQDNSEAKEKTPSNASKEQTGSANPLEQTKMPNLFNSTQSVPKNNPQSAQTERIQKAA